MEKLPNIIPRGKEEEDAAEIMQGDVQSSGIFCFVTTKRISITLPWISGAVLGDCVCGVCVCVHI